MEVASGWDLEDEFTRENVEELLKNYIGSAYQIFDTYIKEIVQARRGN
jgi:hypothetical protein